jgi:hypothetical protein
MIMSFIKHSFNFGRTIMINGMQYCVANICEIQMNVYILVDGKRNGKCSRNKLRRMMIEYSPDTNNVNIDK